MAYRYRAMEEAFMAISPSRLHLAEKRPPLPPLRGASGGVD